MLLTISLQGQTILACSYYLPVAQSVFVVQEAPTPPQVCVDGEQLPYAKGTDVSSAKQIQSADSVAYSWCSPGQSDMSRPWNRSPGLFANCMSRCNLRLRDR